MRRARLAATLLLLPLTWATAAGGAGDPASWTRWGGPNGDFTAPAAGLASTWPEGGPRELWSRPLGEGYSGVLFERGRLYTMYRVEEREAVVCLDAASGKTVWEYRYEHAPRGQHIRGYGAGPRSTPLIVGDLLFTIGVAGKLQALRKEDGTPVWSRDLWGGDFDGNLLSHGYSSSPTAYGDLLLVVVGDERAGLVAFDQRSGEVKWTTAGLHNSYSTPRIVELAGRPQILAFVKEGVAGIDPENGERLWSYEHTNQWGHNITQPEVLDGDTIFISSPQIGARGLRLTRDGDAIAVEEVWSTRRVQFYHGSSVRIGEWVYGSSGMTSPAFMTAVNMRTGEIGWRKRGFAKANCVKADGRLLILDEEGKLYLATATPEDLHVHAEARILEEFAWTAPTVIGHTLYARDNHRILALDLGVLAESTI